MHHLVAPVAARSSVELGGRAWGGSLCSWQPLATVIIVRNNYRRLAKTQSLECEEHSQITGGGEIYGEDENDGIKLERDQNNEVVCAIVENLVSNLVWALSTISVSRLNLLKICFDCGPRLQSNWIIWFELIVLFVRSHNRSKAEFSARRLSLANSFLSDRGCSLSLISRISIFSQIRMLMIANFFDFQQSSESDDHR